jgi:TonB family protein
VALSVLPVGAAHKAIHGRSSGFSPFYFNVSKLSLMLLSFLDRRKMIRRIQLNLSVAALVTTLVSVLSVGAFGLDPSSLEAALQSKYVGKVFTLRGFYGDDRLHYDSNGNPRGNVHPGSWTTSLIAIQQVKISADKVELKGLRFAEIYDSKQSKFVPVRTKLGVSITVDRDVAAQSDPTFLNTVEHIFLGANERLVDVAPDYWKVVLSSAWETVPQEKGPDCQRIKGMLQQTGDGDLVMPCEENAKTKTPLPPRAGIDVSSLPYGEKDRAVVPPQVLFDPSAEYSEVARSLKFQGKTLVQLTVTASGAPADIAIVGPIGGGLDDQAARAVGTWKFKPARLRGNPVPVRITVEVAFNMW